MAARRTRSKKPRRAKKPQGPTCDECGRTFKTDRGLGVHTRAKHARGPGRPSKLTKEVVRLLTEHLEVGVSIPSAIVLSGITEPTYYRWMELGEKELAGEPVKKALEAEMSYGDFVGSVKRAMAQAELSKVQVVNAGQSGKFEGDVQWQSAAWWLERRNPEAYAKLEKREHTGKGGGPIAVSSDPRELSDDELRRIAAAGGDGSRGGAGAGST